MPKLPGHQVRRDQRAGEECQRGLAEVERGLRLKASGATCPDIIRFYTYLYIYTLIYTYIHIYIYFFFFFGPPPPVGGFLMVGFWV